MKIRFPRNNLSRESQPWVSKVQDEMDRLRAELTAARRDIATLTHQANITAKWVAKSTWLQSNPYSISATAHDVPLTNYNVSSVGITQVGKTWTIPDGGWTHVRVDATGLVGANNNTSPAESGSIFAWAYLDFGTELVPPDGFESNPYYQYLGGGQTGSVASGRYGLASAAIAEKDFQIPEGVTQVRIGLRGGYFGGASANAMTSATLSYTGNLVFLRKVEEEGEY